MSTLQVNMTGLIRDDAAKGKGPAGRLRKDGRVPAIVYGRGLDPTAISVDALELYHALRTKAGMNVLIRMDIEGKEHLTIVREVQRHAVRGDFFHVDFQAVDRNQLISAEIPIHLINEESVHATGGIINLVLYTVPIMVTPLEVPEYFELDADGMVVGDVTRVEDLLPQLPEASTFDIELDRTVLTINAPTIEEVEEEELDDEAAALMAGEDGEDAAPAGDDDDGDAGTGTGDDEG